jgi:hypothetical protein
VSFVQCAMVCKLQRLSVCKSVREVSYCAEVCNVHCAHMGYNNLFTIVWSGDAKQM